MPIFAARNFFPSQNISRRKAKKGHLPLRFVVKPAARARAARESRDENCIVFAGVTSFESAGRGHNGERRQVIQRQLILTLLRSRRAFRAAENPPRRVPTREG